MLIPGRELCLVPERALGLEMRVLAVGSHPCSWAHSETVGWRDKDDTGQAAATV